MLRSVVILVTSVFLVATTGGCSSDEETPEPIPPTATSELRTPSHIAPPDERIQFEQGLLAWDGPAIEEPTSLAFGPDGRLYVGQLNGQIIALTLDGQSVSNAELIAGEDAFDNVLGLAFDPTDTETALFVSHSLLYGPDEGSPFANGVSKLTAPDFVPEPVITGLPSSNAEHGTNSIVFDRDGRLFIAQGGTTNAGITSERFSRPETPLSSAILVADLAEPAFDGVITYDPAAEGSDTVTQVGGGVRVFAPGFRNPFDLVIHSNGNIYATDNGPNGQDGLQSAGCDTEDEGPTHADELNRIIEGEFYGHPNRNRGRADERQCVYYPPNASSPDVTGPIATLGFFTSSDGITEYGGAAFEGLLEGDLIYVEWAQGRVWRVVLTGDGTGVDSVSQLIPDSLVGPLDIVEGPDGTLYIAEISANQVRFLRPAS